MPRTVGLQWWSARVECTSADVAGQLGIYHDEYVKMPEGWRFRSRRHETNPVIGEVEL